MLIDARMTAAKRGEEEHVNFDQRLVDGAVAAYDAATLPRLGPQVLTHPPIRLPTSGPISVLRGVRARTSFRSEELP